MENKDSQQKRDEELVEAANEEQLTPENDTIIEEAAEPSEVAHTSAQSEQPAQPQPVASSGSKAWIAIAAVLAIVLVVVLIKPPFGGGSNEAVATVNGVKITKDALYDELVKAGGASTVENMITQELIDQAAKEAKVTVTDEDINKEITDLQTQFGSEEALNQALAQYGMTMDSLKEDAAVQVKIRKILEPQVTVTDEQVQQYYDENKASFATPEQIRASHILVGTKEEAEDILKQLNDGADFATLAKEKSTDTQTKDNGGDLDFFAKGSMEAAFEDAAFALDVNAISGVVETSYGFHIIKKTDHKDAATPTFEEKKEEIREQLVTQQVSELSTTWMEDLRTKAKITNTLADDTEAATDAASNAAQ